MENFKKIHGEKILSTFFEKIFIFKLKRKNYIFHTETSIVMAIKHICLIL